MTSWYRARFLFCSFSPLYLLLFAGEAAQHDWKNASTGITGLFVMGLSACAFFASILMFNELRSGFEQGSPMRYAVDDIEPLDESVLSYMLSYIPPLMIDDLSSWAKVVPACVFYAVLMLIMFRTDTVYVNPLFLLFRYRIMRAKLPSGRSGVIITRRSNFLPEEILTLHEIQPSKLFYAS
ncbi:hypothetical protein [Faunimonas pinastri]|uniref:hypothetical protein n=1 Tax=Faunimonas pinastri TaxID=1855383 RepID=UPI000B899112|nr:hypothetical protein [Faunimonas pinastri]